MESQEEVMKRLFLFCFAAAVCAAQGPKIFIVTDMEGVGGVNNADEQLLPGQRRYEESRRLLTGEVNAAVVGALEAGASQVVIWDGHDASRSLSIDEIHPRAQLIEGRDTPADSRIIDLSHAAAARLGMMGGGVVPVTLEVVETPPVAPRDSFSVDLTSFRRRDGVRVSTSNHVVVKRLTVLDTPVAAQ